MKNLWTVLGVIAAIFIAWWIVSAMFSLMWFVAKLAIVAVVAALVFVLLRRLFTSSDSSGS